MLFPLLLAVAATTALPQASIPFFSRDGTQQWRADGSSGLYVQSIKGQWYRAELLQRCSRLPAATGIRFIASPPDRLDRDSAIVVEGQRCRFRSLVASDAPPRRQRR